MARRVCTTVPGQLSVCCMAAQGGYLGRPVTFQTRSGATRCGVCTTHPSTSTNPKKRGRTVFQFRFAPNTACNITSGCPYLPGQGTTGGGITLGTGQPPLALPAPGVLSLPQF